MCSKNVHRVLLFYFNGNYHGTCSIVLLYKIMWIQYML